MLKIYMGYSLSAGPSGGAVLIFAKSAREAKKIGWKETIDEYGGIVENYIDFAVKRLRNKEWLYKEANPKKLANNIPHAVMDVRSCSNCEEWGQSEILDNGLCEICNNELEEL